MQFYEKYHEYGPRLDCTVSLQNISLWEKFNPHGNEMIITKSGRRMFPALRFQVKNLAEDALYSVYIVLEPCSSSRFKYSSATGWFPAGSEETQSSQKYYVHPESPARGKYWMSQTISFEKMKLTNTVAAPNGQVVLSSMHKYQPRLIIAQVAEGNGYLTPSVDVAFPETQFVAVTAYQNDTITKLKIDHNPFAKGFRENGQGKCKRKRMNQDDDRTQQNDDVRIEDARSIAGSSSSCSTISTPEPRPALSNDTSQARSAPPEYWNNVSPRRSLNVPSNNQSHRVPPPPVKVNRPISSPMRVQKRLSPPIMVPMPIYYPPFNYPYVVYHRYIFDYPDRVVVPKITDFSIRAITGCD